MNREMRRMMEREERRQKKDKGAAGNAPAARTQAAATRTAAPTVERKPFFSRVRQYLHEVRVELKKVNWPSREQMIRFTTVTLVVTVILTMLVFGLDVVMKGAVFRLFEWLGAS